MHPCSVVSEAGVAYMKNKGMIVYNSRLAKFVLRGKKKKEKGYITLLGISFTTASNFLSMSTSLEMKIHRQQYSECFWVSVIPAAVLCVFVSPFFAVLPFLMYHILYWLEYKAKGHSAFDYEARSNHDDAAYPVMRRSFAWKKWYWKSRLPHVDD